jgi:carbon storage regulator CsrA
MLVLTRKVGKWLVIGNVRIKVIQSGRTRVLLGVEAPRAVKVLRTELADEGRGGPARDYRKPTTGRRRLG